MELHYTFQFSYKLLVRLISPREKPEINNKLRKKPKGDQRSEYFCIKAKILGTLLNDFWNGPFFRKSKVKLYVAPSKGRNECKKKEQQEEGITCKSQEAWRKIKEKK